MIRSRSASQIVGSPTTVVEGLRDLLERTGAQELMVTTMVHDHEARLRSYDLVASAFDGRRPTAGRPRSVLRGEEAQAELVELAVVDRAWARR